MRSVRSTSSALLALLSTLPLLPAPPAAAQAAVVARASPSDRVPREARPQDEYRLGAGDLVRVSVYQNPDLTLEARLTDSGFISFPLLGSLRLGGLGVAAAEQLIADGLRQGSFVRSPQVTLVLLQVRGHQASVLGMVNRPGRYALESSDMRLTDVLALAGGADTAGAERVVVTGTRDGAAFRAEIDLPSVFLPGGRERDLPIRNGDVIWVDRQPQVYIYGEVQRPGAVRLERGMTLLQALATGGGLTLRGTEKGIRVHRVAAGGAIEVLQPSMAERLLDGDVVHVRESLF